MSDRTNRRTWKMYIFLPENVQLKLRNMQLQQNIQDKDPWLVQVKLLCNPARNVT
jgi:hypothetical protein